MKSVLTGGLLKIDHWMKNYWFGEISITIWLREKNKESIQIESVLSEVDDIERDKTQMLKKLT